MGVNRTISCWQSLKSVEVAFLLELGRLAEIAKVLAEVAKA
jgi:hypothetical protein